MAWECPSTNNSKKEIISALRGIINNGILLILQQCISVYGSYTSIYRTLGKVLNMGLITMVKDVNVQDSKTILKARVFFQFQQVLEIWICVEYQSLCINISI